MPPIVKDDGRSYARKSLPVPPDFPAPPAPDYTIGQSVASREAYGTGLKNLGAVNPKVYAVDGDVKNSTFSETLREGLSRPARFRATSPSKTWCSLAVGMAAQGLVPFVDTFACFLSRAYDQVRMAAISRSNINLCGSHCGVSIGEDGPSQMALEDLAMFRAIPGAAVFYPADAVARRTADRRSGAAAGHLLPAHVAAEDAGALHGRREIPRAGPESAAAERRRPRHRDRRRA